MGIPGLHKEIGPGERIALAKIAVEHLERNGRPFRVAIDIAIWQFQQKSGQGGKNAALRTLYYRLVRLLALGIRPVFVFDGPKRPALKRNVKITPSLSSLDNTLTKGLLKYFSFPWHDAPGEAEAECALLQREGLVDAVLSEDVDALVFGSTFTIRNWSAEGVKGSKVPTHVNVHRSSSTQATTGLDREGMILVALMSGGDYDTAGIPGCGIKVACQAARAGFGKQLCCLDLNDTAKLESWRENLQHELRTNEGKFFKQKHKSMRIPEGFPDATIIGYYLKPAISSREELFSLRGLIEQDTVVDTFGLRKCVGDLFNWRGLVGAKHFIRSFAPAILAHKLGQGWIDLGTAKDSLEARAAAEKQLILSISGRRTHWNTGGCPELRIGYIPADIVDLNLSQEEDINTIDVAVLDAEAEGAGSEGEKASRSSSPNKRRGPSTYEPMNLERIWVLESFVCLGAPLTVETWYEDMRKPAKAASRKPQKKTPSGPMDQYVKLTKPASNRMRPFKPSTQEASNVQNPDPREVQPASGVPITNDQQRADASNASLRSHTIKSQSTHDDVNADKGRGEDSDFTEAASWSPTRRPSDTYGFQSTTRYSALGVYPTHDPEYQQQTSRRTQKSVQSTSTTLASPPSTPGKRARQRSDSPLSHKTSATIDLDFDEPLCTDFVTIRTPRRRSPTKPSPCKKRTPRKSVDPDHDATLQYRTPTSLHVHHTTERESSVIELTPSTVNRKLDFSGVVTTAAPKDDELPSPSTLLSPQAGRDVSEDSDVFSESNRQAGLSLFRETSTKSIMIRESLEGAWKHIELWEVGGTKEVISCVEVVDLTTTSQL